MKTQKTGLEIALEHLRKQQAELEAAATTLTTESAKEMNHGYQCGIHFALGLIGQLVKQQPQEHGHYCNTGECEFCTEDCQCSLGSAVEIDDGQCASYNLRIEMDPDTMGDTKYHEMVDAILERRAS